MTEYGDGPREGPSAAQNNIQMWWPRPSAISVNNTNRPACGTNRVPFLSAAPFTIVTYHA